jgi:hypothetical protein
VAATASWGQSGTTSSSMFTRSRSPVGRSSGHAWPRATPSTWRATLPADRSRFRPGATPPAGGRTARGRGGCCTGSATPGGACRQHEHRTTRCRQDDACLAHVDYLPREAGTVSNLFPPVILGISGSSCRPTGLARPGETPRGLSRHRGHLRVCMRSSPSQAAGKAAAAPEAPTRSRPPGPSR